MPRQVVPTDKMIKFVRKSFPKHFFKSALQKLVKISKKAMLKQIGSSTDKIISKAFLN